MNPEERSERMAVAEGLFAKARREGWRLTVNGMQIESTPQALMEAMGFGDEGPVSGQRFLVSWVKEKT